MSRSFLFVPGDSEQKLAKAEHVGADALIIDLEDSVQPEARPTARGLACEFLTKEHAADVWVRINALDSVDALEDLRSVMPSQPGGIVLPKPEGARDVNQLSMLVDVLEQENNIEPGRTALLPIVTERPIAMFHLHEYAAATPRLSGLAWGAEDLSAAVGALANRDADGNWLPPYELARSLTLFAAAASDVVAIDTVYTDFRDLDGLAQYATAARRDGFAGMLAIHPDQVAVINAAFLPTETEIARARKIVKLFSDNPEAGTLGMDGEMIDRPHLVQAERILERAASIDRKS
ncbi:MAG: HpcH/HpaI aldolase/citrate lyase family protein [Woeseiaceae bacterium]